MSPSRLQVFGIVDSWTVGDSCANRHGVNSRMARLIR